MDFEGLRKSTSFRTARTWSWAERTPGTARTLVLSAFFVTLVAIPALLMNPAVFAYVVEFAALSRTWPGAL